MKSLVSVITLLATLNAFAGTCQVVARSENGAGAFRSGVEKSKNLAACLKEASVISEGWENAMVKYTDSQNKETVLKIETSSADDFSTYYRGN